MSTTSGGSRRAASTAAAPSPASPTTSMSRCGADEGAETGPDERLVVGEQHADGHRASPGPRAVRHRRARRAGRHADPVPVPVRARLERAADRLRPARACRRRRARPRSLAAAAGANGVRHVEGQRRPARQPTGSSRAARTVLVRVGQRLLHDAVRGQVDDGRQPALRAARRARPRRGRSARASASRPSSAARPGLGDVAGPSPGSRSTSTSDAQLGEHARGGVLHVAQRGPRAASGRVRQEHLGHPALHADDGDVVAQHVVQLTGDAQPLLRDAAGGLDLAALLGALGAVSRRGQRGATRLDGEAGGDHDREQRRAERRRQPSSPPCARRPPPRQPPRRQRPPRSPQDGDPMRPRCRRR